MSDNADLSTSVAEALRIQRRVTHDLISTFGPGLPPDEVIDAVARAAVSMTGATQPHAYAHQIERRAVHRILSRLAAAEHRIDDRVSARLSERYGRPTAE